MSDLTGQQERFCQLLAEGMNQCDAYRKAGYKSISDQAAYANSSRLIRNDKVAGRIAELRSKASERAELTAAILAERLDRIARAAEKAALSEKGTFVSKEAADVARQSMMDAAKLLGLIVDQSRVQSDNVHYTVSDSSMSEEEWEATYAKTDTVEPAARSARSLN